MPNQYVKDTLAAAGYDTKKECTPESIKDQLLKLNEKFQDELKKTVDDLSYKTFGNFFTVTAALLGEAIGGAAVAIVDHLVGQALLQNAIGAITSAISMLFAAIPGASIILRYYAAITLKEDINRRKQLARILLNEIRTVIYWVKILSKAPVAYRQKYYDDLKRSFAYVSRARRLVNIEKTKSLNNSGYISGSNIQTAVTSINNGISYLIPSISGTNKILRDFQTKWKLKTKIPTSVIIGQRSYTPFNSWTQYVQDLIEELQNKYTKDEAGSKAFAAVIYEMVPALPDFLRKFAVNYAIGESSRILIERFPIWILKNNKINDYISKRLTPSANLQDYLGVSNTNKEYAMFSAPDTEKITWQRAMEACKLSETAFILVPVVYNTMKMHSSLIQTALTPADSYLETVYTDMKEIIKYGKNNPGSQEIIYNKKLGSWVLKLEASKTILNSVVSDTGFNIKSDGEIININSVGYLNAMRYIEETSTKLEDFIKAKNPEEGDQILTLANTYLLSLVGQSTIFVLDMLDVGSSKPVLAGLRAIETLLVRQIKDDTEEERLINNFISAAEMLPGFKALKKRIDNLLNEWEIGSNGSLVSDLVKAVRHGNLTEIASFLDIASFSTTTIPCAVNKYIASGGGTTVASRIGTALKSVGLTVSQQLGIAAAITNLKKKYEMIDEFKKTVNEAEGTV